MKVFSKFHPEISIENPAFISVRYGDDTPNYYAINQSEFCNYADLWSGGGAIVEAIPSNQALAMINDGAWFGIREATVSGVCSAWGRLVAQP